MNYQHIIHSQFLAALDMLQHTIEKCPESLWNDPADKNKFWHVAYHALYYTHLYLQSTLGDFKPWAKLRDVHDLEQPADPCSQEDILEYLAFCRQEVMEQVSQLNLEAESGFYWLPFNKAELQIYNIRHLQQHTGELMERLWARAGIEVGWSGMEHE